MLKHFLIASFSIGIVLFFSQNVRACSCGGGRVTTATAYSSAKVVFVGKVLKISPLRNTNGRLENSFEKVNSVTLEVKETFKGVTSRTIEIVNVFSPCGLEFKKNKSYLVYTNKGSLSQLASKLDVNLLQFEVGDCTETKFLKMATEEIQEIRAFIKTGLWKQEKPLSTKILY